MFAPAPENDPYPPGTALRVEYTPRYHNPNGETDVVVCLRTQHLPNWEVTGHAGLIPWEDVRALLICSHRRATYAVLVPERTEA